ASARADGGQDRRAVCVHAPDDELWNTESGQSAKGRDPAVRREVEIDQRNVRALARDLAKELDEVRRPGDREVLLPSERVLYARADDRDRIGDDDARPSRTGGFDRG